jgi:hypothetical protein
MPQGSYNSKDYSQERQEMQVWTPEEQHTMLEETPR